MSRISFVQLGDWGGTETQSYTNPSQIAVASSLANIAEATEASFMLALGDNFYEHGLTEDDWLTRFKDTWESVYIYDYKSLNIPWYPISGNHDHRGNVSLQMQYSKQSKYWIYPSLYHKHTIYSSGKEISLDIILMDTTTYTGVNSGDVYPDDVVDMDQHEWLEVALAESTADFVLVMGHYPVFSVCEHGSTQTLINNVKPLLEQYQAHYLSGHDHCLEHIVSQGVNYWLNGIGHGCCYQSAKTGDLASYPNTSLKYLLANEDLNTYIDDDGVEIGVNGTIGGFTSIVISAAPTVMNVSFFNQEGVRLYSSLAYPRSLSGRGANITLSSDDHLTASATIALTLTVVISFLIVIYAYVYKTALDPCGWGGRSSSSFSAGSSFMFQKVEGNKDELEGSSHESGDVIEFPLYLTESIKPSLFSRSRRIYHHIFARGRSEEGKVDDDEEDEFVVIL